MNYSAELYQAIFNTAEDPVFVIEGATQTILQASAQAARATGYLAEELQGLGIGKLFRDFDGAPCATFGETECETRNRGTRSLQLLRKNAQAVFVNVRASAFKWDSASYILLIARTTDVAGSCTSAVGA